MKFILSILTNVKIDKGGGGGQELESYFSACFKNLLPVLEAIILLISILWINFFFRVVYLLACCAILTFFSVILFACECIKLIGQTNSFLEIDHGKQRFVSYCAKSLINDLILN
jgi:hypothetical protein